MSNTYKVTDPTTGRTVRLTGDSPPTEQELEEVFASIGGNSATPQSSPMQNSALAQGADTTAKITVGALAGKGIMDFMFAPAREIGKIQDNLRTISKDVLGEPKISLGEIPSRIQRQGQLKTEGLRMELSGVRKQLANFDNAVLSNNVETLAASFKDEMPKFFNETYNMYGKQLDSIDTGLIKSGKMVTSNQYLDVINKTINESIAAGVPEDRLGRLIKFRNNLTEMGESSVGQDLKPMQLNKPSSIRQIKGFTRSLAEDIPAEAAFKLRANYGKLLEANFPDAKSSLSAINKDYAKFAQMRQAIYKTADPATGVFDKTKLNRMLFSYAQSKAQTGLQETINLIASGTSVSPKVPKFQGEFARFSEAIAQRKNIQQQVTSLNERVAQSKMNTLQWLDKSERLLAEASGIAEKHPIRSGAKGKTAVKAASAAVRSGTGQIISKMIRPLGILPMISGAVSTFYDPEQAIGAQLGFQIPDKGTKERDVLESIANKTELPEGVEVSEDERKEILIKWGMLL